MAEQTTESGVGPRYPAHFCQHCGELVGYIGRAVEWLFGDLHACMPWAYKQGATYCAARFGGSRDKVIAYNEWATSPTPPIQESATAAVPQVPGRLQGT
jgi:hypothetical protein